MNQQTDREGEKESVYTFLIIPYTDAMEIEFCVCIVFFLIFVFRQPRERSLYNFNVKCTFALL